MDSPPRTRVRLVCRDLHDGGAARGTARIIQAIRTHADGIDLEVRTALRDPGLPDVNVGMPRRRGLVQRTLSRQLSSLADRVPVRMVDPVMHSRADVRTGLAVETNRRGVDVVNLHWLGTGTLSVGEISRISAPVVWTLTDMWPFCGAEHYAWDERFVSGYRRENRPSGERGPDWNRVVWRRKIRAWRRPMRVIAKSEWMADCVRRSALMSEWPVRVIPNPIDTTVWRPLNRTHSRVALGLPSDGAVVAFGAVGGSGQPVKGGDLLFAALEHLATGPSRTEGLRVLVFGDRRPAARTERVPFPVHRVGRITDDRLLRLAYAAADVVVVPSRLENLGNVAIEAQACARPVVAFDVGGFRDIVVDGETGLLAPAGDAEALARCIARVLEKDARRDEMGEAGRRVAQSRFDPRRVAAEYAEILAEAADSGPRRSSRADR